MSEGVEPAVSSEAVQPGHTGRRRRRWPRVLGIVVLVLVAAYVIMAINAQPAPVHPFFESLPDRSLVIAHQGGERLWPSNTMFAFERAVELGVDVLEMDMHSTADGHLVLMHDDTVDRTTDGSGAISSLTLNQLKELDAGYYWTEDGGQSYPYRGQGISVPTLEEVLTAFPALRFNIEIKPPGTALARPFCQVLRDHGLAERVLVGSFHTEALAALRQECPEVAASAGESEALTFYILHRLFLSRLYSPSMYAMQVPETSRGLTVVTPRYVRDSHARNMDVHVWTVNETADMARLLEMGVDGIITDYPDRLLALLEP
jgi:glycerophosphoryl diester phosphodiesterase